MSLNPEGESFRVFMLGWEFPPFIRGGLETACYGLTRAMDSLGMRITFVLPKKVTGQYGTHGADAEQFGSGEHYGRDMYGEVQRYAAIAAELSLRKEFNIIHAYDIGDCGKADLSNVLALPRLRVLSVRFDRLGRVEEVRIYTFEFNLSGRLVLQSVIICKSVSERTRLYSQIVPNYGIAVVFSFNRPSSEVIDSIAPGRRRRKGLFWFAHTCTQTGFPECLSTCRFPRSTKVVLGKAVNKRQSWMGTFGASDRGAGCYIQKTKMVA